MTNTAWHDQYGAVSPSWRGVAWHGQQGTTQSGTAVPARHGTARPARPTRHGQRGTTRYGAASPSRHGTARPMRRNRRVAVASRRRGLTGTGQLQQRPGGDAGAAAQVEQAQAAGRPQQPPQDLVAHPDAAGAGQAQLFQPGETRGFGAPGPPRRPAQVEQPQHLGGGGGGESGVPGGCGGGGGESGVPGVALPGGGGRLPAAARRAAGGGGRCPPAPCPAPAAAGRGSTRSGGAGG